MAPDKVTLMILDVDLKCPCCYKKVKKLLCKFPEIRDQIFDEDKNQVRITVVCCNPEKIRDKLCCKGGKAIQRIEIVEDTPPKRKTLEKPKDEKPKETERPKDPEKSKSEPPPVPLDDPPPPNPPPPQPKDDPPPPNPTAVPEPKCGYPPSAFPVSACCPDCYQGRGGGPCEYGYGRPLPPSPKPTAEPVRMPEKCGYPPSAFPVSACCPDCYQGRGGGPCEYGYGRPLPPPPGPCYDGYGYAGNRPYYATRCDYFSEENPQGCWIM